MLFALSYPQGCVEFLQMLVLRCKRSKNPAYPTEIKTLGDHIRKTRLDRQLSQNQVATILGVTSDTVTNWELNRNSPRNYFVSRIYEFLGFDPTIH
jgi:DNA-binding transcriptional regulator YiaG